jgi:hypothetical protein
MFRDRRGQSRSQSRASSAKKSCISTPRITLSKRGSVVYGIGEKPADSSIVAMSKASFGFSGGIFLPPMTRNTIKALRQYGGGGRPDILRLLAADDVVPILESPGKPMGPLITFLKTAHEFAYRRRSIERLVFRIARSTLPDKWTTHPCSMRRDNVTAVYGLDARSPVPETTRPSKLFSSGPPAVSGLAPRACCGGFFKAPAPSPSPSLPGARSGFPIMPLSAFSTYGKML